METLPVMAPNQDPALTAEMSWTEAPATALSRASGTIKALSPAQAPPDESLPQAVLWVLCFYSYIIIIYLDKNKDIMVINWPFSLKHF